MCGRTSCVVQLVSLTVPPQLKTDKPLKVLGFRGQKTAFWLALSSIGGLEMSLFLGGQSLSVKRKFGALIYIRY